MLAILIPDLASDVSGFLGLLLDSARSGNYKLLASLALIAIVYGLRRFVPALQTDRWGALLVVLGAGAGAIADAFIGGASFGWQLLVDALQIGIQAAGGFVVLKKLLFPSDK